jgi:hypothetical protein
MAVVVIDKATGEMRMWWDNAAESARGFDSTPYATDQLPDYDVVVVDETMGELNEKIAEKGEEKLQQRLAEKPELEQRTDEEARDILERLKACEQTGEPGATSFMDVEGNLTDVWLPLPPKKEGLELVKSIFEKKGFQPDDLIKASDFAQVLREATDV